MRPDLWLLILLICHITLGAELKVVTFNIRRLNVATEQTRPKRSWVEYPWAIRSVYVARQIISSGIDIVGFQEVRGQQMQDLQNKLSSRYDSVFRGRNADPGDSEGVPVFWLRAKFSLVSVEHFWLSTTPSIAGSKSWDSSKIRMATKVYLQPKSKNVKTAVVVVNTHWDGNGVLSRRRAAPVVLREARQASNIRFQGRKPLVLLIGDFNAIDSDPGYSSLTGYRYTRDSVIRGTFSDTRKLAGVDSAPTATGFKQKTTKPEIDHIFVLDNGIVGKYWHVSNYRFLPNKVKRDGASFRTSDHRAVMVVLSSCAYRTSAFLPALYFTPIIFIATYVW